MESKEKDNTSEHNAISEAYHKAKADGSNPELVKAVEDLLGKPKETTPTPQTGKGESIEDKKADIERRRQKELDSLFSKTQASVDKRLNTPVEKIINHRYYHTIKEVKKNLMRLLIKNK